MHVEIVKTSEGRFAVTWHRPGSAIQSRVFRNEHEAKVFAEQLAKVNHER